MPELILDLGSAAPMILSSCYSWANLSSSFSLSQSAVFEQ